MIQLKDYQKKAVKELKTKLIELLNLKEDRLRLVFKAPTGSGKTVMVSAMMDELQRELKESGECQYTRVAWVWIAPNKLHQQSYRSMRNFFSETRSLRPVMFDECEHLEGLRDGEVLFLNWESINKDNAVLIRDNEQNRTLYELLRRTRIEHGHPRGGDYRRGAHVRWPQCRQERETAQEYHAPGRVAHSGTPSHEDDLHRSGPASGGDQRGDDQKGRAAEPRRAERPRAECADGEPAAAETSPCETRRPCQS